MPLGSCVYFISQIKFSSSKIYQKISCKIKVVGIWFSRVQFFWIQCNFIYLKDHSSSISLLHIFTQCKYKKIIISPKILSSSSSYNTPNNEQSDVIVDAPSSSITYLSLSIIFTNILRWTYSQNWAPYSQ